MMGNDKRGKELLRRGREEKERGKTGVRGREGRERWKG